MRAVIGLGNPGLEYLGTRHNAGFEVVEKLAYVLGEAQGTKFGAHFLQKKNLFCDMADVEIAGTKVLLVKPNTYMNDSGKALQAVLHWYKLKLGQILVVHDDVSLPLGRTRWQKGGGAGGQHGVESIIQHLGGQKDFDRLKVGVGPDPGGDRRADFVLSRFGGDERKLFDEVLAKCAADFNIWFASGIDVAMNLCNGFNADGKDSI